ncbi:hypothetical protein SJAG_02617 [Schizosaccharomyces japonicus yFS275]|uniref:Uncharacterized protein n=1 Tax=Schizosaccharomyces japonicus (strain yFS275 / FY16936) TaxID=402676 RepID=B6K0Q8_SCHJY|nr:hypothetical protein SJAG_02617 [Schizosaccharomyces japonicus yFS275]EEB07529.1 hypothetical protein SJAG_02617 [Schizosaccharomyces japonicus yFS275]
MPIVKRKGPSESIQKGKLKKKCTEATTVSNYTTKRSLLELLPYEILVEVFLLSKNANLPVCSKILWHRLSYNSSRNFKLSIQFTLMFNRKSVILATQHALARRYFRLTTLKTIDDLAARGFIQLNSRETIIDGKIVHQSFKGFIPRRILLLPESVDFIRNLKLRGFFIKESTLSHALLLSLKRGNHTTIERVCTIVSQDLCEDKPTCDEGFIFQNSFDYCILKDSPTLIQYIYKCWNESLRARLPRQTADAFLANLLEHAVKQKAKKTTTWFIQKGIIPNLNTLLMLQGR